MRGWVEQLAQTHLQLPYLAPTALLCLLFGGSPSCKVTLFQVQEGRNYILGKCLMYKYKNHMDTHSVCTTLMKQNRSLPWEFRRLRT